MEHSVVFKMDRGVLLQPIDFFFKTVYNVAIGGMNLGQYEEKLARIQRFRPIDDTFFEVLVQDERVCEEILRTILGDSGLDVLEVTPQKSIKNLFGRSVRLDALCRTGTGEFVNIEVQRADSDDHLRRVRYNASCVTASVTEPGEKFNKVPTVYAVYISEFDPFGIGLTTYHIDSVIRETGAAVDDGFHRVFVNTKADDGTETAQLMKCFLQEEVNERKFPEFSNRVHMLKHSEGGISKMCAIMEEYAKEYAKESDRKSAEKLFRNGAGFELVKASIASLSEEELREIYQGVHGKQIV